MDYQKKKINKGDLLEVRNKLLLVKRNLELVDSAENYMDKDFFKKEANKIFNVAINDLEYFISIGSFKN